MESLKLTYQVEGGNLLDAGEASSKMKRVLKQLGLPAETIRKASICMYEGEINMVIHADGGEAAVQVGEDDIIISMRDTGPGIPSALRRTLFERGASSKGRSRGTGLALVREVVEAYHGDIRVESETGVGTSFFLSFRREPLPAPKEEP